MPTRGIPFPTGDPELVPDEERRWRRQLLDRALEAVQTPVEGPTVFDAPDQGSQRGVDAAGASRSAATKASAP